jgi:hypothetical protein
VGVQGCPTRSRGAGPVDVPGLRGRPDGDKGDGIAFITTDVTASAAEIVALHASRWSIEVCFHDGKKITGVGETRNRAEKAVQRSLPFTFMAQTTIVLWYTSNANPEHKSRNSAETHLGTHQDRPITMDMLYALRGTLMTDRINGTTPGHAASQQTPNHQVGPQRARVISEKVELLTVP